MARPTPKKSTLSGRSVVAPSTPSPAPAADTLTQERPAPAQPAPAPAEQPKPASEATTQTVAPASEPTPTKPKSEPKSQSRRPAKAKGTKSTPAKAPTPPAGTTRAGIYFEAEEFEAAKAAYLADWQNGGEQDTFTRWIAAAIITHARRTPKQRAQLAQPENRVLVNGVQRTFNLPEDAVQRMREAIIADGQAGRWPSDSAWCADAVAAAVNAARERNGGTLPTPPSRLPNRLKR